MKRVIVLLLFILPLSLFAQPKKLKSFVANGDVTFATVDRAGDFYLVFHTGEIQKLDKDGEQIAVFKGAANLTSFDPTNAIRLLVFYAADQHYAWLTPGLENSGFQKIDPSWGIDPVHLCPSGDRNLWIIDNADVSLRKINPATSQVVFEFPIPKEITITRVIEYLNFIFLLDSEKGIYIFNSIGKQIRKIEVKNVHAFYFLGEELYYQQEDRIHFFDLYSAEERSISLPSRYKSVLLTDERMFVVDEKNEVTIFEYIP